MVNMNKIMKKMLRGNKEYNEMSKINLITEEVVSKTKLIRDCIIFDEDGMLDESEINFSRILKFDKDWTGYEVSCNELRFPKNEIPSHRFIDLAEKLDIKLSQKYEGRKFGVILSVVDDWIDLRFHTYRKDEGLWLDKDLNKYDNPILYRV
ncbi:MAG: hypothetical protein HFG46_00295 [Clostridium sp.]|jgi:hypothetical protein|nr:hypothetical protein [Clostridium sp.]